MSSRLQMGCVPSEIYMYSGWHMHKDLYTARQPTDTINYLVSLVRIWMRSVHQRQRATRVLHQTTLVSILISAHKQTKFLSFFVFFFSLAIALRYHAFYYYHHYVCTFIYMSNRLAAGLRMSFELRSHLYDVKVTCVALKLVRSSCA